MLGRLPGKFWEKRHSVVGTLVDRGERKGRKGDNLFLGVIK